MWPLANKNNVSRGKVMKEAYHIIDSEDNLELTVSLPENMVRDLAFRSEENGRDIRVELMLRLARSLERDRDLQLADQLMESSFCWEPMEEAK